MPEVSPGTEHYCEHCGGKLDIRITASDATSQSAETTCTVCGRKDGYNSSRFTSRQPRRSLLQRLLPFGQRNPRPRIPRYLSLDGTVDIRLMLEEIGFPVYALKNRPKDLRFKGMGMGSHESKTERSTSTTLTYQLGHPRNPQAAFEFNETTADPYRHTPDDLFEVARTEFAFEAVSSVVRNNSSEDQGKRWFYDGSFSQLWNRDQAALGKYDSLEIDIAGESRSITIGSWEEPFDVSVFTFTLPPAFITACSFNLPHRDAIEALSHLSVLQGDEDSLAIHTADLAETRNLLWPER